MVNYWFFQGGAPTVGGSKLLENWCEIRTLQTKQKTTFDIVVDVHFLHFLGEIRAL